MENNLNEYALDLVKNLCADEQEKNGSYNFELMKTKAIDILKDKIKKSDGNILFLSQLMIEVSQLKNI